MPGWHGERGVPRAGPRLPMLLGRFPPPWAPPSSEKTRFVLCAIAQPPPLLVTEWVPRAEPIRGRRLTLAHHPATETLRTA
ncbi:hypothetical protein E2562_022185 [Oryza meyeriana var. granulata]|uniref:Uncharacterized protein n=1 Tax=Oryza meyeriana var. granulata TaxID=110450 RepID=A0A6G1DNW8_9ORYZ|nr:hypothetical protein E2562_022185 [Oryza meyeriana var. granulata]